MMDKKSLSNLPGLGFLKKDIYMLEEFLKRFTDSLEGVLHETVKSTLNAGGKRIRPLLFLICARNENYDIDYLMPAAASIEMIHTASLIHDDIIDKSVLRRGKKTVYYNYGKDTAKFVGDYLFTHTFSLLNGYNDPEILFEMSDAANLLVKGEFDQLKTKKDFNQGEAAYFEKIKEKTSSLFILSCALGGILSRSGKRDIENMKKFGEYVGISFQINDDLIDVDTDMDDASLKFGKTIGNDLRQGNITLPFIYGFNNPGYKNEVKPLLLKEYLSDDDLKKIFSGLLKTDAISEARKKFEYYLIKARETAGLIQGYQRRKGLHKICDLLEMGAKQAKWTTFLK